MTTRLPTVFLACATFGFAHAQATLVKDLETSGSSFPSQMIAFKNRVWFGASVGATGHELYVSNGKASGTGLFKDFSSISSVPTEFEVLGGRLLFNVYTKATGIALWSTDGSLLGTKLVKLLGNPIGLKRVGNKVYFSASDTTNNAELWVTDGTTAGTKLVKDIRSGTGSSFPEHVCAIGTKGRFVFAATDVAAGRELWISDGTTSGTTLLADIWPGSGGSKPRWMTSLGTTGTVVFAARAKGDTFPTLWITDGTASGTKKVGASLVSPEWFAPLGDKVCFAAKAFDGVELFVTDGTAAGTKQIADIATGPASSSPQYLTQVGSRYVYFSAWTAKHGRELWRSDGSAAGTVRMTDLNPGTAGSDPKAWRGDRFEFAVLGKDVYFAATDGKLGVELYRIDSGATGYPEGRGCGAGTRTPTLRATDPVLGKAWSASGGDAYVASVGILILGAPAAKPFETGGGCTSYIDFTLPIVVLHAFAVTTPSWSFTALMPSDPALAGLHLESQAWFLPTNAARGYDATNAVRLVLGK